ncbi:MAG TPA: xanthine dehydrogenase family protein molybdopterin-binding subunit [Ktedonobacterales bacterium]|nr:xanthine dehydrogenase family protein molybdopterin-binding subunit [Ktedonobacterales bacterium]
MPIRIITTRVEFEGQVSEQRVVMEGDEPPVWGADAALEVVGKAIPRVDGRERVTGSAQYTFDVQLPGMLTAAGLRSPHPHARVKQVDTSRAEAAPGVRAVYTRFNAADLLNPNNKRPIFAEELLFQGQEVAVVLAETRQQAIEALRLIEVEYEQLPFVVDPEAAVAPGAPRVQSDREGNSISDEYPKTYERGEVERGFAEADVVIEARFTTASNLHNSMETHGAAAIWDGHTLTVWSSTQDIFGVRTQVATALNLQQNQVHVIKRYMGGGFGSKFGAHNAGVFAAWAAYKLGRPVKYMLSREEENLAAGNRPESIQTYKIGAKRDGALTAIELRAVGNVGALGAWFSSIAMPTKEMYQCPNVRTIDVPARTNLGTQASFRAPGVVEGIAGLDVALDDLARELQMDPLELRRKNYAPRYQLMDKPYAAKTLLEAYDAAARSIGWATRDAEERRYPRGRDGTLRRGVGMASQLWGGEGGPPAQAIAKLLPDGSAVIMTGTQDIGTGTRTVLAQIASEELGIPISAVRVELGETEFGVFSPPSGGSMTLASVGPAVRMAAAGARRELMEIVSHLAEAPADALDLRNGAIVNRETGREMGSLGSFLGQLDGHEVTARGMRGPNPDDVVVRTFGAQFAEVEVDIATGVVRVLKIVAAHDCGRIVNPLTFSSQIEGGVIQGLGMALFEQRVVDERFGVSVNPNLGDYKVPTIRDIPEIEIITVGRPNEAANTLGSLGAGEPPIIPTPGAIANAVAHAIGKRVTGLPLTPDRVLSLLSDR